MIKLHLQDAGSHKICTKIIVCTLDLYCTLFNYFEIILQKKFVLILKL